VGLPRQVGMAADTSATRDDAVRGLSETAGYLAVGDTSMFVVTSTVSSPRAGIVVCSPFQAEANSQYRWEVLLARGLADGGFAVIRFDYRGTGTSGGSLADLTFERMTADAIAAAGLLRSEGCPPAIAFFGIGFGGLVAAAASRELETAVALRGPTLEGGRYFREAFRAHRIAAMSDGTTDSTPPSEILEAGAIVDLLGNPLPPAFYHSARHRTLEEELGSTPRPVLITHADRGGRTTDTAQQLASRLEERGFDVAFELDPVVDSFWLVGGEYRPVEDAPETAAQLRRVGKWMKEHVPAGPTVDVPPADRMGVPPPAGAGRPVFIPAGKETLFGMLSTPESTDIGAIVLQFGHSTMSTHRNRLWNTVGDALTAEGVATLRFDYHGVGCSSGSATEFRTDRPFVDDLAAAAGWMAERGYRRLLLFGECYGARTAMAYAPSVAGLAGMFLVAPGLRDHLQPAMRAGSWAKDYGLKSYLRKAFSLSTLRSLGNKQARRAYRRIAAAKVSYVARRFRRRAPERTTDLSWVSSAFVDQLRALVSRRVPIHFVYGTADGHNDVRAAMRGELGKVAAAAGDLFELTVKEGKIHGGGTRLDVQDEIARMVLEWTRRTLANTVPGRSG